MTGWLVVVLTLVVAATGCTPNAGTTAPPTAVPTHTEPGTVAFHLDVTNQSIDIPRVRLAVAIDGNRVIDEAFELGTQHTVVRYDLYLGPGERSVTVRARIVVSITRPRSP